MIFNHMVENNWTATLALIKSSIYENFKQSFLYTLKLVEKKNQHETQIQLYQLGIYGKKLLLLWDKLINLYFIVLNFYF